MAGKNGRGSGASPFADFSSFRERVWVEREATPAELEAAAAEARIEREMAAVEQRRLIVRVFELKL